MIKVEHYCDRCAMEIVATPYFFVAKDNIIMGSTEEIQEGEVALRPVQHGGVINMVPVVMEPHSHTISVRTNLTLKKEICENCFGLVLDFLAPPVAPVPLEEPS